MTRGLCPLTMLLLLACSVLAGPAPDLETAPEVTVASWHNTAGELSLESLRGKVVLLDFWGVWCSPCVKSIPDLNGLMDRYGEEGLVVIGIHTPLKSDQIEDFVRKKQVRFAIGADTGETARSYAVTNFPTYFLVDRKGRLHPGTGELPDTEIIEDLLREQP